MLLLYDADCGFCSRSASWLSARGVEVRALQSVGLGSLGVDAVRAAGEIPGILPGGGVVYGARAIGEALRGGPRWLQAAGWLIRGPLAWPAAFVYRLVAQNRHSLPGGTGECRL